MIDKVIKDKLTEAKMMMAQQRRFEIRKHLDYYSGTSTEQYIKNYFTGDAFNEIPPTLTNFTRKFINKISGIYTLGAKRNTGNTSDLYESLTPTKDVRLKHSDHTIVTGKLSSKIS